jgi:hypothetical protein
MNIPVRFRPFLLPAACLASAVTAFGLGRMTSFVDSTHEQTSVTARGAQAADRGDLAIGLSGAEESRPEAGIVGASASTASLEDLTGGKPIGDWLTHLLGQDDEIPRLTGFLMLLERVNTQADFEATLGTILQSGNGPGRNGREFNYLLQRWTTLDPQAAMAYVQGIEPAGTRTSGTNTILQAWAKRSPQDALAWARANGTAGGNAAKASISGIEVAGKTGTAQWAGGNTALGVVIGQIAKTDALQALQLTQTELGSVNANASNTRAISNGVVNQLIAQRGDEAAREAVLGVSDETLRSSMLRQLVGRVAGTDPQKAAAWATGMLNGEAKAAALADVMGLWVQKDAMAAATYMTQLPVGAETDGPRARLARGLTRIDPAAAADWAYSISNSETRTESLSTIVGSWMQTDTAAAKQWVENSSLPQRTKRQIMAAATADLKK